MKVELTPEQERIFNKKYDRILQHMTELQENQFRKLIANNVKSREELFKAVENNANRMIELYAAKIQFPCITVTDSVRFWVVKTLREEYDAIKQQTRIMITDAEHIHDNYTLGADLRKHFDLLLEKEDSIQQAWDQVKDSMLPDDVRREREQKQQEKLLQQQRRKEHEDRIEAILDMLPEAERAIILKEMS